MDLVSAAKSLALSPRKRTDTVTSDGELKLDQIDSGEMFLYGNNKPKNGVNRIVKMPESGEVFRNNLNNENVCVLLKCLCIYYNLRMTSLLICFKIFLQVSVFIFTI